MSNPNKVLLGFTVLMLVMFGGMNIAPAQTASLNILNPLVPNISKPTAIK